MLKKRLYNQNENDNEMEEMGNDSELKELGDEGLDSDELGATENPKSDNEDESGALDEEN